MTPRVLVVDDDAGVRFLLRELLLELGCDVVEAGDGAEALERLAVEPFELVIADLRMPRLDGMQLLRTLAGRPRPPRVIMVTAHGSERHAVEAMKSGAYDYLRKPFDNDELVAVVQRALGTLTLERENERLAAELNLAHSLVFAAPAMGRLALQIARVAPRDVTVLITGESGTGKERIAEALVRASRRAERPFVRFNCAALTAELAEAELFGHARGAFTGAHRARPGLFREAHGGTLLLDEVGELSPATQAKLLRVLQDGEVRPVGEERAVSVDVRIIAATHRDLVRLAAEGRFREDLYYRLKVVTLEVPPLRERQQDIPALAQHFLVRAAGRFGLPPIEPSAELLRRLAAHTWPGNVRELENVIESLVANSDGDTLDLSGLPGALTAPPAAAAGAGLRQLVDQYERSLIVSALAAAGHNRSEAARALGVSRGTLHEKLKKYDLAGG